jgi:hypothetical protein
MDDCPSSGEGQQQLHVEKDPVWNGVFITSTYGLPVQYKTFSIINKRLKDVKIILFNLITVKFEDRFLNLRP